MRPTTLISTALLFGLLAVALPCSIFAAIQKVDDVKASPTPSPVVRTKQKIKIDGIVDPKEWQGAAKIPLNNEFQPGENVPAPVKAECYLTFDDKNLYVAFVCQDDEPSAIRAHYTDRDQPFSDDFVGLILDTYNDERHAYEFFVNPFGIQMDGIRNEVGGPDEDESWDAIWDSAGRITAQGYEVELALPFNQLSFKRSEAPQIWGIVAFRNYPREHRYQMGNIILDRNRNCTLCQFPKFIGFEGVEPGRNLELDPTVTARRTDEREDFPEGGMVERDSKAEVGLTARWGVTSNLTMNAAINPDFSNVEADVAQLDINTQFALDYPEKRPFFLEDFDTFETPGRIVYSRTVADPSFGVKLTGKVGGNAIGFFTARDEITNLIFPGSEGSQSTSLAMGTTDTVFRLRRDIGGNSALGFMVTDREGEDYHNRLVNVDGVFRPSSNDTITFQVAGTQTRYPDQIAEEYDQEFGEFGGLGIYGEYSHSTRNWGAEVSYQGISDGFRADLGFMPQVGIHEVEAELSRQFWGDANNWFTQGWLEGNFSEIRNRDYDLLDRKFEFDGGFTAALQSNLWVQAGRRTTGYEGQEFKYNYLITGFSFQPTGGLDAGITGYFGGYVDFDNVRPADRLRLVPYIEQHFGRHLFASFSHVLYRLTVDGGRLFLANLSQLKVVYQFNSRTFLRAIFQFEDLRLNQELYTFDVEPKQQTFFTQILFSYKINPRTVLFLGYSDNYLGSDGIDLTQTDRTFFAKLGYAWIL
jgi:hypothetical protein